MRQPREATNRSFRTGFAAADMRESQAVPQIRAPSGRVRATRVSRDILGLPPDKTLLLPSRPFKPGSLPAAFVRRRMCSRA